MKEIIYYYFHAGRPVGPGVLRGEAEGGVLDPTEVGHPGAGQPAVWCQVVRLRPT